MAPTKSKIGEGYTVRVKGRKLLKTALLEEQLMQTQREYEELLQQNRLLWAKEAVQLNILETLEAVMQHMRVVACVRTKQGSDMHGALMSAALLNLDALQSKQDLQLQQHDGPISSASASHTADVDSGYSSNDGAADSSVGLDKRTRRLFAGITMADVQSLKGISVQDLAGHFRAIYRRLALAHQAAADAHAVHMPAVEAAVDAFSRLCMLGVIAAEQQISEVMCLNLESMQHNAPPADLWHHAVSTADLQPGQRQLILSTIQWYKQQQALLLQQQDEITQQLHALLSRPPAELQAEKQPQELPKASSAGPSAAATANLLGSWWSGFAARSAQTMAAGAGPSSQGATAAGWPLESNQGAGSNPRGAAADAWDQQTSSNAMGVQHAGQQKGGSSSRPTKPAALSAGMLTQEDAEQLDQLVQHLLRVARMLKQHSRRLVCMWTDLLSAEQHARVLLAGYPYTSNVLAMCECVWKAEQRQQETALPA